MRTLELNCVVRWVVCELGSRGLDIIPKRTNAHKCMKVSSSSAAAAASSSSTTTTTTTT